MPERFQEVNLTDEKTECYEKCIYRIISLFMK